MRDPARIPKVLAEVQKVWEKHPDLRLGQLVVVAASQAYMDAFYIEDENLVKGMEMLKDV